MSINRSKGKHRAPRKDPTARGTARPPIEETIRSVRGELEGYVSVWIHELEDTLVPPARCHRARRGPILRAGRKTLPFDYFKIDGDFIRGIAESPMDQLVVRAIVDIARGMGKKTIAEFVTDAGTALLLEKAGVDYAQGYHVGKPRPLLDVLPGGAGSK